MDLYSLAPRIPEGQGQEKGRNYSNQLDDNNITPLHCQGEMNFILLYIFKTKYRIVDFNEYIIILQRLNDHLNTYNKGFYDALVRKPILLCFIYLSPLELRF